VLGANVRATVPTERTSSRSSARHSVQNEQHHRTCDPLALANPTTQANGWATYHAEGGLEGRRSARDHRFIEPCFAGTTTDGRNAAIVPQSNLAAGHRLGAEVLRDHPTAAFVPRPSLVGSNDGRR